MLSPNVKLLVHYLLQKKQNFMNVEELWKSVLVFTNIIVKDNGETKLICTDFSKVIQYIQRNSKSYKKNFKRKSVHSKIFQFLCKCYLKFKQVRSQRINAPLEQSPLNLHVNFSSGRAVEKGPAVPVNLICLLGNLNCLPKYFVPAIYGPELKFIEIEILELQRESRNLF